MSRSKTYKTPFHCSVCGTLYRTSERSIHLFSVPKDRLEQWKLLIPGLTKISRICEIHFDCDDILKGRIILNQFYPFKLWKLARYAVPKYSLNVVKSKSAHKPLKIIFPNSGFTSSNDNRSPLEDFPTKHTLENLGIYSAKSCGVTADATVKGCAVAAEAGAENLTAVKHNKGSPDVSQLMASYAVHTAGATVEGCTVAKAACEEARAYEEARACEEAGAEAEVEAEAEAEAEVESESESESGAEAEAEAGAEAIDKASSIFVHSIECYECRLHTDGKCRNCLKKEVQVLKYRLSKSEQKNKRLQKTVLSLKKTNDKQRKRVSRMTNYAKDVGETILTLQSDILKLKANEFDE